jgi:hypothetical protein
MLLLLKFDRELAEFTFQSLCSEGELVELLARVSFYTLSSVNIITRSAESAAAGHRLSGQLCIAQA